MILIQIVRATEHLSRTLQIGQAYAFQSFFFFDGFGEYVPDKREEVMIPQP